MHWRFTCVECLGRTTAHGDYQLRMAAGDGLTATAVVRAARQRPTPYQLGAETFDPAVTVVACTDASACEWLQAQEHEYFIAEQLLGSAA